MVHLVDMSLFKWSSEFIIFFDFRHRLKISPSSPAPARQGTDRILPIIPNEIYFCIFEHIAPQRRLTPEQLGIFTNLSHVCRFFANFCLPRIFEFVNFSGSIFCEDTPIGLRNDTTYKTSRESILCRQIAVKQPLALALAKAVRVCHFTNWKLDDTGSWAVRLFVNKYIAGMLHMRNICELKFTASFVDAEHWNAIATLGSLEELSFEGCTFLQVPADVEPDKKVAVKVSRLRVVECDGFCQLLAAIDARYLRTLAMDNKFFDHVDWLSQSALTELHITFREPFLWTRDWHMDMMERVHDILMHASQSLEALAISVELRLRALDTPSTGVCQSFLLRVSHSS